MTRRGALLALVGEGFLSRLSSGVIGFALPLYALELGLSFAEISVVVTLNLIVGMLLKSVSGRLVDRVGSLRAATVALCVRSQLYLLFAISAPPVFLCVVQALRGVTKSVRDPALYALLALYGGKKRVARTFGWYQAAKGSAGSLGHALAGFLLAVAADGFGWVFAVAAVIAYVPCLLLPALIPKGYEDELTRAAPSPRPESPKTAATGASRTLAPYMGFGFLVSISSRMLYRMMPLLLVAYAGLDNAQAGFLYLFAAIVPLIAAPVAGWLYDHVSPALVLQTRSLLNAGSSFLYVVSPTLTAFALGKLMDKTGTSAFGPAWGALMAGVAAADPKRRADRMAIMSASRDAGNVSGPILAGVLWSLFGPVPMLLARLALAVASGAYTVFLVGWLKRHEANAIVPAAADVRGGGP